MGKRYASLARRVCAALMALSMLSGMLPAVAAEEGALAAVAFSAKDPVACEQVGQAVRLALGSQVETVFSATSEDGSALSLENAQVRFHSSAPEIVSVDGSGKITAAALGAATVTAAVTSGGVTRAAELAVTVQGANLLADGGFEARNGLGKRSASRARAIRKPGSHSRRATICR